MADSYKVIKQFSPWMGKTYKVGDTLTSSDVNVDWGKNTLAVGVAIGGKSYLKASEYLSPVGAVNEGTVQHVLNQLSSVGASTPGKTPVWQYVLFAGLWSGYGYFLYKRWGLAGSEKATVVDNKAVMVGGGAVLAFLSFKTFYKPKTN